MPEETGTRRYARCLEAGPIGPQLTGPVTMLDDLKTKGCQIPIAHGGRFGLHHIGKPRVGENAPRFLVANVRWHAVEIAQRS